MGTIIVVQTITDLLMRVFGPDFAREGYEFLTSRIPNITTEEKATLDQHYADYLGWKF